MRRTPPKKEGFFCVGVVIGAHGIKGEVVIKPFTEYPEDIANYGVPVDIHGAPFSLSHLRKTPKGIITYIDKITDRNASEKLKGTYLYVPVDNLPELGDDDAYISELKKLKVLREDGSIYGLIKNIFETSANVVMEVFVEGQEGLVLLPFTEDVVVCVDRENSALVVSEMADQFLDL